MQEARLLSPKMQDVLALFSGFCGLVGLVALLVASMPISQGPQLAWPLDPMSTLMRPTGTTTVNATTTNSR